MREAGVRDRQTVSELPRLLLDFNYTAREGAERNDVFREEVQDGVLSLRPTVHHLLTEGPEGGVTQARLERMLPSMQLANQKAQTAASRPALT